MTGKKAAIVFALCLLAPFFLPSFVLAVMEKPTLRPAALPTKALAVAHSKPTLTVETKADTASIPLSDELVYVLVEACEVEGVPLELAVAVMEQESGFDVNAVNPGGCYGLMQLNPAYFPRGLSPADNIRAGVGYLGELLATYDTTAAAVTAYFYGPSERVSSWYSCEVLERVERWSNILKGEEDALQN